MAQEIRAPVPAREPKILDTLHSTYAVREVNMAPWRFLLLGLSDLESRKWMRKLRVMCFP